MEYNVIFYDEYVIGKKKDLENYLYSEMKRQRQDFDIEEELLTCNLDNMLRILSSDFHKMDDYTLYALYDDPMGGLTVKEVGLEFSEIE